MTYSSEVQELGRKVNEAFMHGTKEEYEAAVREFSKKAREELRNVEGAVLDFRYCACGRLASWFCPACRRFRCEMEHNTFPAPGEPPGPCVSCV
jgi:hypothetical protein